MDIHNLESGSELDRLIHTEVMGLPIREIPDDMKKYGEMDENSPLWEDIVQRAIDSKVILEQINSYKGVNYGTYFDGWHLSYSVCHSESYRASENIRLDGKVENWKGDDWSGSYLCIYPAEPFKYSTDIEYAFKVLDHLVDERGYYWTISTNPDGDGGREVWIETEPEEWYGAHANTLPLAICRAAYMAIKKISPEEESNVPTTKGMETRKAS